MEWIKIRRGSDGCINQHTLDYMYVQLPIIVVDKMTNVFVVTKHNWIHEKGFLDAHKDYTHYLPIPELKGVFYNVGKEED